MEANNNNKGNTWRMREWGRAQYRNQQAKLRSEGESSKTASAKRMLSVMCPKLGKRIDDFMKQFGGGTEHTTPLFLTFVLDMCPYETAIIALRTFLDHLDRNLSVSGMAFRIGKAFENEARWKQATETFHPNKLDLLKLDDRSKAMKLKQFYLYEKMEERFTLWDARHKTSLGAWLLEEIRLHTGLWQVGFKGKRKGHKPERLVLPTKDFTDWVRRFDKWMEGCRPFKMALDEEPVDWHTIIGGGYSSKHIAPIPFFTGKPLSWFEPHLSSYSHVFSAVNNMQKVAWSINEEMLEISLRCWENKRVVGNIPQFGEIDEQPRYTGECPHELRAWKLKQKDIKTANEANGSKRFQACRILHLAKIYKKWDKVFFPYRCDYRGRVYALPHYLHPQGNDLAKSLLDFKKGEQVVDEDDLETVLVHGANMWGVKGTRQDRIEWVNKRKDFILEAANDPHGTDWWTDASDPFCFLRFCLEYKKFTEEGYGYVSYLPVRQDCSNNGMQILSLLLRDKDTGKMCNLVEADRSHDLYQQVADRVYNHLKEDGGVIAQSWMQYGFTRKLAKLSVMNRPYGSSSYMLTQNIFHSIGLNHPWESTGEMLTAVMWLCKIVNKIADEVCKPVNSVMKFLKQSVRELGYEAPIMWTTPTGFKVVQSFRKTKKVSVDSVFDNTHMKLHTEELADEIDPKGQQDAITANFIHSLDASIVHQVANFVDFDAGYIHDCFVTHACNARAMNAIVRRTYSQTFNVDLLTEFRMEQINTNPEAELPSVPELGDLDVSAITQMKYLLS